MTYYDSLASPRSSNLIQVEELSLDSPTMISMEDINLAIASHSLLQNCSTVMFTPSQYNKNNYFSGMVISQSTLSPFVI
jgi:hypothetical protein